jgi:hypothetical protein
VALITEQLTLDDLRNEPVETRRQHARYRTVFVREPGTVVELQKCVRLVDTAEFAAFAKQFDCQRTSVGSAACR